MFHKVKNIAIKDNYKLLVTFFNDEIKEYDVSKMFEKNKDFKSLTNITGLFNQVKVDVGGYGISWNDDLDLSCDELYFNGVSVQ